jgi:hypothetical protein
MTNKNLKLTLAALIGGVAILSAGTSLSLTSCSNTETVLSTVAEAEQYLQSHVSKLNKTQEPVTQTTQVLANDTVFNNFLNSNLTTQNLVNALVQQNMDYLTPQEDMTSSKIYVKVDGNNLSVNWKAEGVLDGQHVSTYQLYEFTLNPGKIVDDLLVPAKLSGTITVLSPESEEPIVKTYGGNEGLLLTEAYVSSYSGYYRNVIGFGTQSATPGTYTSFKLTGNGTVQDGAYVSTLDTENVTF